MEYTTSSNIRVKNLQRIGFGQYILPLKIAGVVKKPMEVICSLIHLDI